VVQDESVRADVADRAGDDRPQCERARAQQALVRDVMFPGGVTLAGRVTLAEDGGA
jgi:hypothetical protein